MTEQRTPSAGQSPRARVLVVDNDRRVCADLGTELSRLGYDVTTIGGHRADLVGRAAKGAQHVRPHVAIIDLRLQDEYTDEHSGLQLLDEVKSAYCIIYSAHLTTEVARRIAQRGATWINKESEPQQLLDEVAKGASHRSAGHRRDLTFHWPSELDGEVLSRHLLDGDDPPPARLMEDVLAQLFPAHQEFNLSAVTTAAAKPPASRGHSVVLRLESGGRQPTIVKFLGARQLRAEERNYREDVVDRLGGPFYAVRKNAVEFWDIGAAEYTFMGLEDGVFPTFSNLYAEEIAATVLVRSLRHFFTVVWHPHYCHPVALGASLFADYDRSLGLCRKLVAFQAGPALSTLPGHLTDPVAWVLAHADESRIPGAQAAVTHGDLHADNLFALRGLSWVIDYERTGLAHILRDFVELEVDVLTRLVGRARVDDREFLGVAGALAAPAVPGGAPAPADWAAPHTEMHKALAVIQGLRQIALHVTRYSDQREYLWGLLFDSLYVASLRSTAAQQCRRAYLLAAVLAERLRQWEKPWPPDNWPADLSAGDRP